MTPLITNAKSIARAADAFAMVREELEMIESIYSGEIHYPEKIDAEIRQRMAALAHRLQAYRLIPDAACIDYKLETGARVWVYIDPSELLTTSLGFLSEKKKR